MQLSSYYRVFVAVFVASRVLYLVASVIPLLVLGERWITQYSECCFFGAVSCTSSAGREALVVVSFGSVHRVVCLLEIYWSCYCIFSVKFALRFCGVDPAAERFLHSHMHVNFLFAKGLELYV